MDLIFNAESKHEYKKPSNNEKSLRQIWLSLLDLNVFKDHQFNCENEEEYAFSMLLHAISSKFKKLQQVIKSFEKIQNEHEIEISNLTMVCAEKSEENEHLKARECQTCQSYEEQLKVEQLKLSQLEKQMKKCAFLLNTSVEKDGVVLEKVRGFVSQSVLDKNETNTAAGIPDHLTAKPEELSASDIIVPGTPEKKDFSLIYAGMNSDDVHFVPETAPFNFDENGAVIKPGQLNFSPILVKTGKNCDSPKNISMNDSMFYSPPLFPRKAAGEQSTDRQCDDDDDFQNISSRKKSFLASSAKKLKPTKLLLPTTSTKPIPIPHRSDDQMNADESFLPQVPFSPEVKRRKRIKGPEDWTCTECIRLFKESKIDTNKLKASMNFCPEHRNRYSYYLGTPPDFFNPKIGSPRKGRMSLSQKSKPTSTP